MNSIQSGKSEQLEHYKKVAAVLLSTITLATVLLLRTDLMRYTHPDFSKPADHHKYIYMAKHTLGFFHIAPFCWRIGQPLLVRILPFGVEASFLIVTFLSLIGEGVILWVLIKNIGYSDRSAFFGLLLYFSIPWGAKYQLYNFWLPDALSMLFVTSALLLIAKERWIWLGIILALGVTVKESVIFAIPLIYTLKAHKALDVFQLKKSILVVLLPCFILIALRIAIPARNHDQIYIASIPIELSQVQKGTAEYTLMYLLKNIASQRLEQLSLRELYRWTIGAFGLFPIVLGLVGALKKPILALSLSPLILLSSLQPLFATNIQRLVVTSLPALIWLAIEGLEVLSQYALWFSRIILPLGFLLVLPNLIIYNRFLPGIEIWVLVYQLMIMGGLVLTQYILCHRRLYRTIL